jgi:hypothetical protein
MVGLLDFFTGGGEYADPNAIDERYGVSKGDVRQAALNTLGNVSGLLLAAGQPMSGSQRAQLLGQLGPAFGGAQTDIYNAAQRRLLGAENEQKMSQMQQMRSFADRQKSDPEGLAKELGIDVEIVRRTPPNVLQQAVAQKQAAAITASPMDAEMKQLEIANLRADVARKTTGLNSVLSAYGLPPIGGSTQNVQPSVTPQIPEIGAAPVFQPQPGQQTLPQGSKMLLDPAVVQQLIDGGASAADIAKLEIDERARQATAAATKTAAGEKSNIDQENKLRADVEPILNKFVDRQTSYKTMEELAAAGEGASDVALLISLFKVYDPTSTVTGGESATLQNAAGVPEGVRAEYNKLISGGALSQKMREDIVRAARAKMDQEITTFGSTLARYNKLANQYGVNAERVIQDVRDPEMLKQLEQRKKVEDISKKITVQQIMSLSQGGLSILNPIYLSAKQKQAVDARLKQLEDEYQQLSAPSYGSFAPQGRFRPFNTLPTQPQQADVGASIFPFSQ